MLGIVLVLMSLDTRLPFRFLPHQQARDGSNHDRQFGGDEFEVNAFFLMDDDYGEDEDDINEQDSGSEGAAAGDGVKKSRIMVRRIFLRLATCYL